MSLSIAVAQPACVAFDVAANAVAHAEVVRRAGARVVVFPELSLTGYELDAPVIDPGDERLRPLVDACRDNGTVALVGAPVEGRFIAKLAVTGECTRVIYKKLYLGGAEPARYRAGDGPVVFEVDGWRLGLAICKDTGVPEHAAATMALGADVYVAGLAEQPEPADLLEKRARHVTDTYGLWVAFASFAGPTGSGEYDPAAGRSGIWRPDGTVVEQADALPGRIVRTVLVR